MDPDVQQAVAFHGHMCPGLAIGVRAARYGLREIGSHAQDEEVVALVETDMCAVDAIQSLMGCTFGKGNLIHRDWGKNAFSFYRRSDGRAVRVSLRAGAWTLDPEHQALFAKVRAGSATESERARFQKLHAAQSMAVLAIDPDDLYRTEELHGAPPRKARIHTSVVCAECGEAAMETRVRRLDGRELSNLNEAWRALHGLERPSSPTAEDAVAVLEEMGLDVHFEEGERQLAPVGGNRSEIVAFARRRLCVGADRDAEVEALLGPDFPSPLRRVLTVWWDGTA